MRAARRPPGPEQPPEVDVPGQGHAHEVGHDPARRQQAERPRPVADEIAQPAHDLLLDEGRERAGVPDVDALVGHLGEQLAHHRDRQRRRREIAELARVLRVHLARRRGGRGTRPGCRRSGSAWPGPETGRRMRRRTTPAAPRTAPGRPSPGARPGRTGSRGRWPTCRRRAAPSPPARRRVAVADQLGLRVPGEAGERVGRSRDGIVGHRTPMVAAGVAARRPRPALYACPMDDHDPAGRARLVAWLDPLGVDDQSNTEPSK